MKKHYNKATLIGRLTRDPETRTTSSGIPVTRFTIAVDRFRRGETSEKTADFINVGPTKMNKTSQNVPSSCPLSAAVSRKRPQLL